MCCFHGPCHLITSRVDKHGLAKTVFCSLFPNVTKVTMVRDVAQWLERGGLSMSLGAVFSEKNIMFHPSQYWDIVSMLCPWERHITLKCFTWLR